MSDIVSDSQEEVVRCDRFIELHMRCVEKERLKATADTVLLLH